MAFRFNNNNNQNDKNTCVACLLPVDRLRRSNFQIKDRLTVNLFSEFFGTFLLLLIGNAAIAQHILEDGKFNNHVQVCLAWGFAITLSVYVTCKTSGGHLNPAVSLAMCTLGKLPFSHYLPYVAAQILGAYCGAGLCFHVYRDSFNKKDLGVRSVATTGIIFSSFPAAHIGHYTAFVDQVVGTGLLLLFVCALIDPRNKVPHHLHPICFGITVFLLTSSFGMNLGCPINPARDLGPRLFMLSAGYGWESFSWHEYYFWIPIVAPLVGALLGTWSYQFFVGIHVPEEEVENKKKDGEKEEDGKNGGENKEERKSARDKTLAANGARAGEELDLLNNTP